MLGDLLAPIPSVFYRSLRVRDDRRHRELHDAVDPTIDVAKNQGDNRPSSNDMGPQCRRGVFATREHTVVQPQFEPYVRRGRAESFLVIVTSIPR
jgi:hypothetical protein